ncbi:FISUMP domain-containing protein [Flavivirga eckloniae]|uniref:Fibrobacter succinogenes major paralogous domain-containing protein n=1 Tax=Flavivirga eckloniae TaxID=1803846 RepID=A0A2K9PVW5_9FLAO|nr:FISUMP domain-containing protein [Flavivirga eckloniae]AUP80657.1 hypothetical protein C1H87_18835 [Flavivirga eckloniae]
MKYMKNLLLLTVLSLSFFAISCDEDDEGAASGAPNIGLTIQSPADGAESVGFNPTFTWTASGDNTNAFKYDFYIGTEKGKLGLRAQNIKDLKYRITKNTVLKGQTYYWKVVAKDGIYEKESDVWSFTTSPLLTSPVLIGPINFGRDPLKFEWEETASAENEKLTYKVYLGTEDPPTEVVGTIEDTGSFDYNGPELDEFETYYWRIEVLDELNTSLSEVGTFQKLLGGYPDLPSVVAPLDNTLFFERDGGDIILDWTDSTDPEGDTVTYDVYLDTANPPVNVAASFSGDSEYNATSGLVVNTSYYWKVVAKDPSGNSYSTEVFNFDYLDSSGPAAPMINEEVVDGTMSLDESIVWGKTLGAATYDVYIGETNPPTTQVATDFVGESYVVKPKDIPSDITIAVPKTYYARVVAKNIDGEAESSVISFTPQLTGTVTDVRGTESIEYGWVRVGEQVWMTENLRARKLTNGEDILFLGPNNIPLGEDSMEIYYDEHPEGLPGFTPDWSNTHGLVYSSRARKNPLVPTEGWHVITEADLSYISNYVNSASELMGDWHGGSNIYGVNCLIAGFRYNLVSDYENGFRTALEQSRIPYWVDAPGENNTVELYLTGHTRGFRYFKQGSEHLRMWGIRLIKD